MDGPALMGTRARRDRLRSVQSANIMAQFAVEHGLPLQVLLDGAFAESKLHDPCAQITMAEELRLVQNLTANLGNTAALGLQAGLRYHLTSQGVLGLALLGSPTIRKALELALRYYDLSCAFTQIHLVEEGRLARIVLNDSELPGEVRTFLLHRDGGIVRSFRRDLLDVPTGVETIRLRGPAPPDVTPYLDVWGVYPEFDAEENCAVFDRAFLDAPLPQANELTLRHCEEQCRILLSRATVPEGIAGRVRSHVLDRAGRFVDMDTIARRLGMTSRTLRRRLAAENTTYRAIVDRVRFELAQELLRLRSLTHAEIAERLGYADPSSFSHAFKRLAGTTPLRYAGHAKDVPPDPPE